MVYYVYLIKTVKGFLNKSYVGYTNNFNKRLNSHNNNKGAKSTKGYKWELVYKKRFYSKNKALSFEYTLKKDRKERTKLLNEAEKKKLILPQFYRTKKTILLKKLLRHLFGFLNFLESLNLKIIILFMAILNPKII